MAFVSLFGPIAGLGMHQVIVRELVQHPQKSGELLGTAALMQLAASVISYSLILVTISLLRPEDHLAKSLTAIVGSMVLFRAIDVSVFWFESQVLSKYTVWARNTSFFLFSAVKVTLILGEASVSAFAWATLAEVIVTSAFMLLAMGSRGPSIRNLKVSGARAIVLVRDSWPLLLSSISIVVYMKIDQIMLGQLMNDTAVGVYSVAVRISEICYFIPVVIAASVFPSILEEKKRSKSSYYMRLQSLFDLMVWPSIFLAFLISGLSSWIVSSLYGEEFQSASIILSVHIWAAPFVFLGVASERWIIAENRSILSFQRTILGAALNVALNYFLIPKYGPLGAAVSTLISYAVAAFFADLVQFETREIFRMKVATLNLNAAFRRASELYS